MLKIIKFVIITIAIVFVGLVAINFRQTPLPSHDTNVEPPNNIEPIADSRLSGFETNYEQGVLKYKGVVQLPTPCHDLKHKVSIMESHPEIVRIDLTIIDPLPEMLCIQILQMKEFLGEVKVSKDAIVSVYLNDQKIK